MEDKQQSGIQQGMAGGQSQSIGDQSGSLNFPLQSAQSQPVVSKRVSRTLSPGLKAALVGGLVVLAVVLCVAAYVVAKRSASSGVSDRLSGTSERYEAQNIDLGGVYRPDTINLSTSQSLSINGQLRTNNSLVLTPGDRPQQGTTGQIYYDKATNSPYVYDGNAFVALTTGETVRSIGGSTGSITLGAGLMLQNGQLALSQDVTRALAGASAVGVTSLQGMTGAVSLTAGSGIAINGTTISNTGVRSIQAASPQLTVTSAGNGMFSIGTVGDLLSGTGTSGRIAVFGGLGAMADSLMSQSGGTISVDGNLAATGQIQTDNIAALTPGQDLTISAGGSQLVLVSGGRSFQLPSAGSATQTICTVGMDCSSGGGGIYVQLQPGEVQQDTGSSSSISVNNTGGGNLLRLQGGGIDRLVVANDGTATLTGDLNVTGAINGATVNNANINGGTITGANINNASITGGSLTDTSVNGLTVTSAGITAAGPLTLSSASNYDLMLNAPGSGKVSIGSSQLQGTGALAISAGGVDQNLTLSGSGIGNVVIMTPQFIGPNGATYSFDVTDPSGVNATICTSVGNCTGSGGLLGSGTVGTIAVFNGTGFSVGDSLLSQSAGTVTVTGDLAATNLQGSGGSITDLNAGNISVGVLADGRLSNNVALYSSAVANFTGALRQNGSDVCTVAGNCAGTGAGLGGSGTAGTIAVFNGSGYSLTDSLLSQSGGTVTVAGDLVATNLQGNGSAITNVNAAQLGGQAGSYYLNASNISSGTLADGRLSVNVTMAGNTFNGANQLVQLNAAGQLPALSGALLTNLNANSITTGTVADARLSGNVALFNAATANFTGALQQNGNDVCTTAGNCVGSGGGALGGSGSAGTIAVFNGSGYTLTNSLLSQSGSTVTVAGDLVASNLQGNGSAITNVNAAQLGGQAGSYYLNASNISSGTLADARLSSSVTLQGNTFNGANQLVRLDATGQLPAVSGALLTNLNASNIASGTIADGRLSANVVLYDAPVANFTGALRQNGNDVCTTAGNCVGSGGGGALGGSGSAGAIAVFTGSGFTLADSLLSQAGGVVSVGGLHTLSASGANQDLTLQGTGTGRVVVKNPSFNNANGATYVFDPADTSGVNAMICTTAGNCVGSGAGIGGSGSAGTIAVFNGSGYTLTNSLLSQSGGTVTVAGDLAATNLQGNGSAITNVNAVQLDGQAASYYLNASNLNAGVLADARLSSNVTLQGNTFNGANQLVQLNASGQLPAVSGTLLTGLNANNIASGTLADGRLSTNVALYGATTANFTGTLQQNGNNVCTTAGNCVGSGAGGAIGGSGSANTLAMFNGGGYTIANSMVSQNSAGTVLTVSGQLTATAGAAITGNSTIIGTLTGLSGLTSSGTITFSGLNTAGVVHTDASGVLTTSLITNADLQGGTYSAITGTGALSAGSITSGFGVISTGSNISTTATMQAGTVNATSSLQTNGTQRITGAGGLTNITEYSQVSGNFTQSGTGSFSTGSGAVSLNGATTASGSLTVAGVTTLQGGLTQNGAQFTNNGSTLNSALSLPNFASSGSIGTAVATVDRYTSIAIAQTTFGRTLTLPNPTTTTAGRVVYVFNTGVEGFTMHGITVPGGYGQIFLWNGTAWILGANGGSPGLALQAAYDGGNTINTTNGRNIAFTLSDTSTDADFITNIAAGSTGRFRIQSSGTDVLSIGSTGQLALATQGAAGGVGIGGDTLLYRSGVNRLQMSNALTVRNTTNTTTAFQVQNAAALTLLNADTSNMRVAVGATVSSTARLYVESDAGAAWTARSTSVYPFAWSGIAYGKGLYVAVAPDGTQTMTSPDGVSWTQRSITGNGFSSIAYGNGIFVAVSGSGNTAAASPDGITWTAAPVGSIVGAWDSVTYGNGLFVAVADTGTNRVMTSPDGITWTPRTAAQANSWTSVTYGNGLFVAVADTGTNRVMTSPDGITWTPRTAAQANTWTSVTYGNGLFVAVSNDGANRVMTSPDGITWTARAAELNTWTSVTYGNGLFVAIASSGTNRVMTSPDGITWTARAAELNTWTSVTYGNGLFVAVSNDGTNRVMTSSASAAIVASGGLSAIGEVAVSDTFTARGAAVFKNATNSTTSLQIQNSSSSVLLNADTVNMRMSIGSAVGSDARVTIVAERLDDFTWTPRTAAQANSWTSVTYGNGLFVAVSSAGTNRVMTSPDGITWTPRTAAQANTWTSVTYGNGLFAAVSSDGTNRVMTSPDGITWTARTTTEPASSWSSVTYGNGRFVALGTDWAMYTDYVMTSSDGVTWTTASLASPVFAASITYANGLFVAVGGFLSGSIIATSPDGITWSDRTSPGLGVLGSVTYGNGLFVAVPRGGTSNQVVTSPDGITWTARTAVEANQWNSVTYGNGLFVAIAGNGTNRVMTSPDGITWTPRTAAQANTWASVTYGNGLFVAVSSSGTNRVMTSPGAGVAALRTTGTVEVGGRLNVASDIELGGKLNFGDAALYRSSANRMQMDGALTLRSTTNSFTALQVQTATGVDVLAVDTTNSRVVVGSYAAGSAAKLYVGSDAPSWTSRTPAQANTWTSVTYGNGLFVAVASSGTNRVMTSPDGITWTARTAAQANSWSAVTYSNGMFVAVSVDGTNRVMTSPNGTAWTARTAAEANQWNSVTYGNGLFVAVAGSGTNRVMTSPDGITWSIRTAAEANQWTSVTYGNGLFVAVAYNGTNRVMTSPNGITWTARTAPSSQWNSVTYGNGQFVAVADGGTNRVMTSPDGISWTARTAAEANQWVSVVYANGYYTAVANSGTNRIMASPDGITWASIAHPVGHAYLGIAAGGGSLVAVGYSVVASANFSLALRAEGAIEAKGDLALGGNLQGSSAGFSGNLTVTGTLQGSSGVFSGSVAAASFDRMNAGALSIGNANATSIDIGTIGVAQTINIGTNSSIAQTLNIGTRTGTGTTNIQGGTGGMVLHSATGIALRGGGATRDLFSVGPGGVVTKLNTDGYFQIQNNTDGWLMEVQNGGNISTNWNTLLQVGGQATFQNGLSIAGPVTSGYTTPLGFNLSTAINIQNRDLGGWQSLLAMGITAASADSARGILVADARTAAHQPTIGILSPDESDIFGLSWDGSNSKARLKTLTGDIAIQAGSSEVASFSASAIALSAATRVTTNSSSAFSVQTAGGSDVFKVDTTNMGVTVSGSLDQTGTRLTLKHALPGGSATPYVREMDIVGNYAYVANQGDFGPLTIMDITNPGAPQVVSTLSDSLLYHARDIRVAGRYAYIVTLQDKLVVVDIANASSPSIVGSIESPYLNDGHGLDIQGSYIYVAAHSAGGGGFLSVFDISNPANPTHVASVNHASLSNAKQVDINGRYAYVTNGTVSPNGGLVVVDIANPKAPAMVGSVLSSQLRGARDIVISGKYAYVVSEDEDRLAILNISNPSSPAIVGSITDPAIDGAFAVTLNGRYAYVGARISNSVQAIDISNPTNPVLVSGAGYAADGLSPSAVMMKGRYLFVGSNRYSITAPNFTVLDTNGATLNSTSTNTLDTESLQVHRNADITGMLNVANSVVVGQGGIATNGALTVGGSATFRATTNSTDAFKIQSSDGTVLFGVDSVDKKVSIRSLEVAFNITINGHIISGGATPTIAAGAAACTSPTVAISGTDTAGKITVTTGTGSCPASGILATITFATAFGAAPRVTLTPASAPAASLHTFVDDSTTSATSFGVSTTAAAANATSYVWYYQVIQ